MSTARCHKADQQAWHDQGRSCTGLSCPFMELGSDAIQREAMQKGCSCHFLPGLGSKELAAFTESAWLNGHKAGFLEVPASCLSTKHAPPDAALAITLQRCSTAFIARQANVDACHRMT